MSERMEAVREALTMTRDPLLPMPERKARVLDAALAEVERWEYQMEGEGQDSEEPQR